MAQLTSWESKGGVIEPVEPRARRRTRILLMGLATIGAATLSATAALVWGARWTAGALAAQPDGLTGPLDQTLANPGPLLVLTIAVSATASLLWAFLTTRETARELAFLTESRARNRAIVDNMADGAIHIDAVGHLVAMNAVAERMFGYSSCEARGKPFPTLFAEPHRHEYEERIAHLCLLPQTLDRTEIRELSGLRKDGSSFPVYLAMSRVDVGRSCVFTAIVRDLTETHRQMDALARARDAALSADRAKSEFLAIMSHEIRTPMNGVLGMLELLRDTPMNKQQEEFIATAEHSGAILLNVINDILDFSKIEAGKLDLQDVEIDLRDTVEEVTELVASGARHKPIEVASFVHQDVPRRFRGDPYRIRQILLNLMGNAVKFTECGEVIIRVGLVRSSARESILRFQIDDTGIGIDAQILPTLFRPFTQADASTTRRFGGTGLGLVISKRLVELMGGEIGVDSAAGIGSSFWFTLRMQTCEQSPEHAAYDLVGVRVLIVDDNATNRLILENYLQRWGAITVSAEDGAEALAALQRGLDTGLPFDLAILDMQMPGMDGVELAQRIKGDAQLTPTRLLMLSSLGYPGPEARRAGIDVTLLKPVREILLHDAASKLLGMSPRGVGIRPVVAKEVPTRFDANVLVAEDNPVNQKVVTMMLRRFGIAPTLAGDGQAAIDAFECADYDLVLMDIQMPKLNGHEVARHIRAAEHARGDDEHLPILAMTAGVSREDRDACVAAGMDDFISKPVQIGELEAALLRWLPAHATPRIAGPYPLIKQTGSDG
jgi:PAS domain S-box-containing protein